MPGFNHWRAIAAQIKPGCQKVVTNTAKGIGSTASGNAPRETGFMGDSVYTVTPLEGSTYGQGGSPPGNSYLLPEVTPPDDMSAAAACGANYSEWVNYGHHTVNGGWVPAQPFWDPAVENGRGTLDSEMAKLGASLGVSLGGSIV